MEARMFKTHKVRKEIYHPPMWEVNLLDEEGNKGQAYTMMVPGTWETNPQLASYKGKALYSQNITFGGNVRLNFKGVSHTAYVYVDGHEVAYHYNAYTEFEVVLKNQSYDNHLIEVRVDNSFHEESALHVPNDYYSYGGITRPLIIESLEDIYIGSLRFKPYQREGIWYGQLSIELINLSEDRDELRLVASLNGVSYDLYEGDLKGGSSFEIVKEVRFADVKKYSLDQPHLYLLSLNLFDHDRIIDDLIDRVGFREVSVLGKDILFNGEKVIIKGVNRHEDYGDFGCSVPLEGMYRDIEIIKNLGANCIRTCHYPNDERFLDLCDENGILVWEEAHARGLNEAQMGHRNFDRQSADCIREMILNHYNHPSIYVWGILNECVSNTDFGKSIYAKQVELIRSLDDSRPVTYASLQAFIGNDKSLDLVDIVSYNIYPKWYENVSTQELLDRLKTFVEESEGRGKPLLISEIGAGGIYGYRNNTNDKWTEDYQESLVKEQVTSVLNDDELSGVIIWQYADCRVDPAWFGVRPKSQNNKGLVDKYRREKMVYKTVKEIFKNG